MSTTGYEPLAVCLAAGITDPELTAERAYTLSWEVFGVISRDIGQQIRELQDEKRKSGDPEWFKWGISPVDFIEGQDAEWRAELRQLVGY